MTLRLVRDDEKPDSMLYCRWASCKDRQVPATILLSINGTPYMPSCDACARHHYEINPDAMRLAPLSEYVDVYAAAKEAALATPEQFTAPVQVTASTAVDDKVLRCIWVDRVIYCRMRWQGFVKVLGRV